MAPPAAGYEGGGAAVSPEVMEDYRRRLAVWKEARAQFEQASGFYWEQIAERRRNRNAKRRARQVIGLEDYVLEQPPVYAGPRRPVNPEPRLEPETETRPKKTIPVIADFLKAALELYQFTPQGPASEAEFKRAYLGYALAAGLTREQAVRVYAFETGGNGNYDLQSGVRKGSPAVSTALGYNQLLTTNSVELLAEQGPEFIRELTVRASRLSGPARRMMEFKLSVLKRMVAEARAVPDTWSEHEKIANTARGWAMHAMVLDMDVGPMLQTHKLLTSVRFARARGYLAPLTGAELEMMNLTGDGTGLDMVAMPQALREQVPTANFFQRGGYERNPVAIRNNTVAKLLAVTDARMDSNSNNPGARDLAAAN